MSEKGRVDKWLWSIRIFKSRTLATESCKEGKVKMKDQPIKPSAAVGAGDVIEVRRNGFFFRYKVITVLKTRVSATLAAAAYENITPADELAKYEAWYTNKTENRDRGTGRPTKKERRDIDGLLIDDDDNDFDWLEEDADDDV